MKNTINYRLPAFLLAVIMMIGLIPAASLAADSTPATTKGTLTYNAQDAVITYESNGKTVSDPSAMDPNKINTIKVTVPDSDNLPKGQNGLIKVSVPANVQVTSEDAAACESDDVSCTYSSNEDKLVFKWKGSGKAGFTAVVPVSPDAPATREDVSGTWALVVKDKNQKLKVVLSELFVNDNTNRLKSVEGTLFDGQIFHNSTNIPTWKIERKTGDWYSISTGGQYLNYGNNGNHISLTGNPQYFLYAPDGAGMQFISYDNNGNKYFLNNKSNDANKGIQASTYNDQCVELYAKLATSANQAFVVFNTNGGSGAPSQQYIMTEKGEEIVLPSYSGSKSGNTFLGWALVSNLKNTAYYDAYQPGDTFEVKDSKTTFYAVWSPNALEKAQFGIRLSGLLPEEPAQHDLKEYATVHIPIEGIVRRKTWVVDTDPSGSISGNHLVNEVTRNLAALPTDDEIKQMVSSYDPDTMYVHWYVMKWSSNMWKVDGIIVPRNQEKYVKYSANAPVSEKISIKNIPEGYKKSDGSVITVGANAEGTVLKIPTRPGYTFNGWNTKPDGAGQAYKQGDQFTINGETTFYAQWEEIPKYQVDYKLSGSVKVDIPETMRYEANKTVTLAPAEERDGYFFSGWMINGEKIEGSTFKMPAEDLDIQGVYYGPINVRIVSDWDHDKEGYSGARIKLTAILDGPDNLDYTLQWQYKNSEGGWSNVENAHEINYTYTLTAETSGRTWRVIVTDVRPK